MGEQCGAHHNPPARVQEPRPECWAQQPTDREPSENRALKAGERPAAVQQREQHVARRGDRHQPKPDP
jgi:hypothetical protein